MQRFLSANESRTATNAVLATLDSVLALAGAGSTAGVRQLADTDPSYERTVDTHPRLGSMGTEWR